jgi:tetratricopeptide (TPR) repeat protein
MATQKKSTTTATKKSMEHSSTRPDRLPNARMVQNFLLLWLDGSIDEVNNDDCRNSIAKLRQVVNTINTFTDVDKCIDFIDRIKEERIFMIISGAFGETTVPIVHEKPQVSTIYIFCGNKTRHEKWALQWPKVKGVFTDIRLICEALKQAAYDCDQNMVSISFVKSSKDETSKENLDQLDQSFMYTQILKEILLTINFEQQHIDEFLTYCREQFADNTTELKNVEKIRKEYRHHQPIWWYTYQCFLYSMLNKSLRVMDIDLIIKMGFFVRDLHQHITALHSGQYGGQNHSNSFIVYRGQGLSPADFEQLMATQGGLLSFNNFLSTSKDRNVSFEFAQRTIETSNLMGIVFVMKIDPSISATPFAKICDVSAYKAEEEILFSMHSIFRIGSVKQLDGNNRLWQVELTLTSDNDPQLLALTEYMSEEITGSTGWDRLGHLMFRLGQFNKAEELYEILLKQTTNEDREAYLYYMLGMIKDEQGEYAEAIDFYEKSLEIWRKTLPPNDLNFANSYNNIGEVYDKMGEYSKALSYYEKALEIRQKTLPLNHPHLATSYNNIGLVYDNMGEYSKAISYYEKALEIYQKTLPPNHPNLATSYNNIGSMYDNMGEYSNALSYCERAVDMGQRSLPANHPTLEIYKKWLEHVKEKM